MTTCPYCGEEANTEWEEMHHMESVHPEIVYKRMVDAGLLPEATAFAKRVRYEPQ